MLNSNAKIYVAGHKGMVGSAVWRVLQDRGYRHLVGRDIQELDLRRQAEVEAFFAAERPAVVFLAAARVGGILANASAPAEFLYDNLLIAANVIHAAWRAGAAKLVNFGSSCIYPRLAPQPLREDSLLTGALEPTNEAYAVAKIAALKLCRHHNAQYGTDFFSLMPTNLYGPGDNYDLAASHVLPALLRKFHLAKLLQAGDLEGLRRDLSRRPLAGARFAPARGEETAKRRNGETATEQAEHRTSNIEHRTSNAEPSLESRASSLASPNPQSAIRHPQSEYGTQELRPEDSKPQSGPESEVPSPMSADSNSQFAIRNSQSECGTQELRPEDSKPQSGPESEVRSPMSADPNPQFAIRNPQLPEIVAACAEFGISAEAVTLWGTGTPRREFLHVDDLAAAAVLLMENCGWKDVGDFVNVGCGEDLPIRELAEMVRAEVGFAGEIRYDPSKPDGTPRKLLDVSRIRALGWAPRIPLRDGVARTYREYLES